MTPACMWCWEQCLWHLTSWQLAAMTASCFYLWIFLVLTIKTYLSCFACVEGPSIQVFQDCNTLYCQTVSCKWTMFGSNATELDEQRWAGGRSWLNVMAGTPRAEDPNAVEKNKRRVNWLLNWQKELACHSQCYGRNSQEQKTQLPVMWKHKVPSQFNFLKWSMFDNRILSCLHTNTLGLLYWLLYTLCIR